MDFREIFISDCVEKDKFRSRLFGIINEKIADIYFSSNGSKYTNLGRPTIYGSSVEPIQRGHTLDFSLQDKITGKIYVCEMKCELQYENYKHLALDDEANGNHKQIEHHKKPAFEKFLKLQRGNPDREQKNYEVSIKGGKIAPDKISGIILIWGKISEKIDNIKKDYGFYDILSLENMINELIKEDNEDYRKLIEERELWCNDLFMNLLAKQGLL